MFLARTSASYSKSTVMIRSAIVAQIWLWTILILQYGGMLVDAATTDPIVAQFPLPSANNGEEFQNLVVDTTFAPRDRLYLGATNTLYQLTDEGSTLQLNERVRTGPELDSPLCNYNGDCILANENQKKPSSSPVVNKTWTNNYNQILLIHETRKVLVACGTIKQGLCSVHRLENISRTIPLERSVPVAANSDNATTAAFLAPGPSSSESSSGSDNQSQNMVMYVASTFTGDPYRDNFPSVCTRSLADDRLFQLVDQGDVTGQSGLMIRNDYRADFRVYYVGGFHSDTFAYWAAVQRKSAVDSSSTYVSKLLRVCTRDLRYESYSELPLECLGPDNSQYNIMKAFYVGTLGDDAMGGGSTGNEDVSGNGKRRRKAGEEFLVGVFVKGQDPWKYSTSKDSSSTSSGSNQKHYVSSQQQSAVCAFSMKDIRAAFMFNLQRCNSGIGKWNLPHFGFDQKCYNISGQQQHSDQSGDFCQPIRVGGEMPATSAALITYKDRTLTSITADVIGHRTVLFLGTADGRLKKIYLQSIKNGREYGEIQLSTAAAAREISQAVNPDLQFDRSKRHLFAMTPNEVFKVRVETCAMYDTCDSCLSSGDPYCGWCTLENRCSTKDECHLSSVEYGFLTSFSSSSQSSSGVDSSSKNPNCPRIESLNPMNASLYAPIETELLVEFNFLPPPSDDGGVYQCIFETKSVPAEFVAPRTLKCHLPPFADRPSTKSDVASSKGDEGLDRRDHIGVPLKIWSSASSAVFYESRFVFYDCGAHQLCTSCVSSRWPCDWCLVENRCIHDAEMCGGEQQSTTSTTNLQQGSSSLPQGNQCPHIDVHDLPEILLPHEFPVPIVVPVLNLEKLLPSTIGGTGVQLECITKADDHELKVRGWLSTDARTVQCEKFAYRYAAQTNTTIASFHLRTSTGTVIDRMHVRMYKCNLLGPDCSRCLNADPRYQCTWCDGSCQYRQSCPAGTIPPTETARDACPAPVIKSIKPSSGPMEGGTRLEITGMDLGVRKQDVEGRIFIGGRVACDVEEIGYKLAEKVICKTRSTEQPFEGAVEIRLDNQKTGRSAQTFRFVQPSLSGFTPNVGPKSGGTELTISGKHLLEASEVKVFLGNLECKVDRTKSTSEQLVCITSKSTHDRLTLDKLTAVLDKSNRTLSGRFEYTPDPQIQQIHPMSGFKSGGRQLTIRGKYFTSIQRPSIYLTDLRSSSLHLASRHSPCRVLNATVMLCPSPALVAATTTAGGKLRKRNADEQKDGRGEFGESDLDGQEIELPQIRGRGEREPTDQTKYEAYGLGFSMDGVESVRQLDKNRFLMKIVPDPIYERFPDGKKIHRGDPLIIKGSNLNSASSENDVKVMVGDELCNVTLIASDQLVCQPPSKKPLRNLVSVSLDATQPMVIVRVGTLEFSIGQLVYDLEAGLAASGDSHGLDMALVGGVVGGCAALFVVAMVAAAVWWRKKSWQAEKEYKRIQLQMDTLESNVRQECKQAFAELQTDMSDLTGDLVALGIPYHTRRSYAAKILFKEEHQEALRMLDWQHCHGNGYGGPLHHSLIQFEQLLWNKDFLVLMIGALEQQSNFGSQDKVYVASLMTAALAKNMHYLTDLVLELLGSLIGKATQNKFPQLMLRRTESVVEKMLANWIALCMYDYMLEAPGGALFLMFKALKHQTEKGPVDQVTADARYCLSEDRLLKEQIESEPILLRVIPPSTENSAGETVLCRVLSCDTISQVKSKILDALYRNTPFASRPSLCEIDLEWKSSGFAKPGVLLQDDDRVGSPTNTKDAGWRRLHTVQYYGLPNHAIIAVVPKPRPANYAYASGSTHTYMSISSSTFLLSNSSSPNNVSPNSGGANGGTTHNGHAYGALTNTMPNGGGRRSPPDNLDQAPQYVSSSPNGANTVNNSRCWHLVKPDEAGGCGLRNGSIPEIYLTRLLATKGTVQQFIDDFFASALKIGPSFPMAIKFLFDFLEDEAERRGVNDPSVVYAWKNNSLPLRFWVNIIKNPDFLLDVEKTPTVDACLSVIAQTFMDSCSAAEQRLGKDSPSNKLLFARDLPRYRQMFGRFYSDVQRLPRVHLDELKAQMNQTSKAYGHELNTGAAIRELLAYAVRYKEQIMEALETSVDVPEGPQLAERFEQTLLAMGRHSVV